MVAARVPSSLRSDQIGSPSPTPRLYTGVKNGGPALPQGVLGVGDEAQRQHDSGEVETEAMQQGTGHVGAQQGYDCAQALGSQEYVGVQPVGRADSSLSPHRPKSRRACQAVASYEPHSCRFPGTHTESFL